MRIVRLVICLAYWALLTLLLLTPNPAAIVGLRKIPTFPWGDTGLHFAAFAVLAVLVHAVRWPQPPRRLITALLLAYAVVVESLQALVPFRTPAVDDYAESILGVLVATALCRLVHRAVQPCCDAPVRKAAGKPKPRS